MLGLVVGSFFRSDVLIGRNGIGGMMREFKGIQGIVRLLWLLGLSQLVLGMLGCGRLLGIGWQRGCL